MDLCTEKDGVEAKGDVNEKKKIEKAVCACLCMVCVYVCMMYVYVYGVWGECGVNGVYMCACMYIVLCCNVCGC